MTIHYPTGSQSETSRFRVQTRQHIRWERRSLAAHSIKGADTEDSALHPAAHQQQESVCHSHMLSTYGGPASAGACSDKSLQRDRLNFFFFWSSAWLARVKDVVSGFSHQHLALIKLPSFILLRQRWGKGGEKASPSWIAELPSDSASVRCLHSSYSCTEAGASRPVRWLWERTRWCSPGLLPCAQCKQCCTELSQQASTQVISGNRN